MKIRTKSILSILVVLYLVLFSNCKGNASNTFKVLDNYKSQGWEIKDSIQVSLNDDSKVGFAVVLKNESLEKSRLLIYLKDDSDNYELKCDNAKFFNESETGQNGTQKYDLIKQTIDGVVISFDSGGTTRLLQSFCFGFINDYLFLTKYSTEEYDILDVNDEGVINKVFTEEFDFEKGMKRKYTLEKDEREIIKECVFTTKKIKIDDLVAMDGIDIKF